IGTATLGAVVTTQDNLTYTGTLLVRDGGATTFNITNDTVTTAGTLDFTNLDTFTTLDGTVVFNGGATTQAFNSGALSFESIQIGTGSAGAVVSTSANLTYTGTLLVRNGGATTFNISNDTLVTSGTLDFSNLDTFTSTASIVRFNGSSAQSVTPNSLTFVTIDITNTSSVTFTNAFTT